MVEEGIGYALVIDKIVNTSSDNNLCFRPLEPRLESGYCSAAAELFLKEMQKKFKAFL